MARLVRWLPVVLLGLAAVLIGDALVRGSAHAALVLVVPVLTGSSAEFLLGVLLLFVGFLSLPFLLSGPGLDEPTPRTGPAEPPAHGGVILIGPVPIFFGEWRGMSRRAYLWWAALGSVLFVVLLVAALWFVARG